MKRIIAFMLAIAMAISLTGCCAFIEPEKIIERIKPVHTHDFSNYVCSECGTVDTSHAYEYLIEWTKENGDYEDGTYRYVFVEDRYKMGIMYSLEIEALSVWFLDNNREEDVYYAFYLDDYFYGLLYGEDEVFGVIPAETYTRDTTLSYTDANCAVLEPSDYLFVIEATTDLLLNCFNVFLCKRFKWYLCR